MWALERRGYYGQQLNNLTPGQTYYYRTKASVNKNALDLIGNDMTLWLDASDLSSTPSTWADKSGNSRNATKGGNTWCCYQRSKWIITDEVYW